ncbi:unnamed protein product [Mycena citricolor]|uniref:Sas10 C-terminal domain-containing protein n=1 Tax=Mycena citricolor TaxID=2018698 RepID=A0AAD2JZY6_9AGAR|nr:unnamed protein product [Mycena citricolor]
MPRRPKKTIGKPRPVNRDESKIKRWEKVSDIPMDEEDQFQASRDRILLDGDEAVDDNDDGDDDEVFALDLDGSDDDDGEDMEDEQDTVGQHTASAKPSRKAKTKKAKADTDSEEEEEDEEEETWGRGRSAYYSSNAAQIDSDDEEANELEEQEAKRLQDKARDDMDDGDFGLGDVSEHFDLDESSAMDMVAEAEPLPEDPKALLRHLEKTCPETLAIVRDWEDTAENLVKARRKIAEAEADDPDALSLGMIHLHYQTLLAYATALTFYIHIRSSQKYQRRPEELRKHPVMARLLTLKQSLSTLEELDFAASDSEIESLEDSDEDTFMDAEQLWANDKLLGLEQDELRDLLDDAGEQESESELEEPVRPKKKRKTAAKGPAAPVFDLVEPEFTTSVGTQRRSDSSAGDAYGEATALQHADAADKSARKKTLRFHTSKIESASARRQGARTNALGGDDDIPYRETRKAKAVVQRPLGDDLDDAEPQPRAEERAEAEDADGYYDLVKRKAKQKKSVRKRNMKPQSRPLGAPDFSADAVEGPRSLTRAILKNKGLTPRRAKASRNPRVKKREQYSKAKRKVASQKAVFKGGLADTGRYDGERSGISKVVKSVRLGG